MWRVQDSLAVSRAIGDANMKEWIISEPEMNKIKLTPECEFLIMASDGLWDKVYYIYTHKYAHFFAPFSLFFAN